ncbi:PAS domain-containing sensor histidine kinase, partial [bacterium]
RTARRRARAEDAERASEALARALIANLPGGAVFVVDQDLRYELAEGEAFRAAGFTSEASVGRTIDEVLEPELVAQYGPRMRRALAGEPFEVEHTSHGRTFLSRGAPLRDGHRVAVLLVSIDITERRRTEALLRASDARYRTLVENVRDYAIFLLDPRGVVTEWTAGAERIKGYTAEEAIGQGVARFYTPEDVAAGEVERVLAEAAATGRAEREGWRVGKDGIPMWVNEVTTAVHDIRGVPGGFTTISRDMTAQKRIETERVRVLAHEQEARREAERVMVLRDEFLAVISHELRTPLSSILLWAKMLRAGAVPPTQQRRAIVAIETGASAQKQLIEDLLDVSSMLSGKVRLSQREAEIGPVLDAAVSAVRSMAEAKGVRLTLDLEAEPSWACLDPDRMQQVVWNLVSNAVKFTPPGGSVAVRLAGDESVVRITVEDSGQGIALDFLPHVFERFRQQNASRTRTSGGLGLGLAIARQLVELHGGTIEATSEGQGQGA